MYTNGLVSISAQQMVAVIDAATTLDMRSISAINGAPEPSPVKDWDVGADFAIMAAIVDCREAINDNRETFQVKLFDMATVKYLANVKVLRRLILAHGELTGHYPQEGV